tara:strand:+ start:293 stop:454 length:162 start_codon:yes stop_codon:yes gene_type:complete
MNNMKQNFRGGDRMRIQVYFKKNGLSDVELDDEIVAVNISEPEEFVKNMLLYR